MKKVIWNFRVARALHYVRNGNTRFVFIGQSAESGQGQDAPQQRFAVDTAGAPADLLDLLVQVRPDDNVSLVFDEHEDFGQTVLLLREVTVYVPQPGGLRLLTT